MKRVIQGVILVLIAHLFQGSVFQYIKIFDVAPNFYIATIAIATVAYSRVFAFGISSFTGILTECTLAGLLGLNIVFYPAFGFLASILFGDKSERKLEQEIAAGKKGKNLSPHLRTIISAAFLSFVYQFVHLIYTYLKESEIAGNMIFNGIWSIIYTVALTAVVMLPFRYVMGMYQGFKQRRKNKKKRKISM